MTIRIGSLRSGTSRLSCCLVRRSMERRSICGALGASFFPLFFSIFCSFPPPFLSSARADPY